MATNDNDEIELNGVKYVRKQEQDIYDAKPAPTPSSMYLYLFRCGAPDCNQYASEHSWIRNTALVVNTDDEHEYDVVYFTCQEGHRNRLRI